jgi:hypothetical protein
MLIKTDLIMIMCYNINHSARNGIGYKHHEELGRKSSFLNKGMCEHA